MGWAKSGMIVITGNFKFLPQLDRYRDLGYKIFGPTVQSAKLEIDRAFGMEAMKKAGIGVPPYKVFDSLKAAENFARKSDQAWVHKPMGDEEDKSLTYVSKDPADLVGWLQRKQKSGKPLKGQVMLQEKIEADFEIGANGWFGPDGFLPEKYQLSFEHKPLMSGDIGPATGEMISVSQYVETDKLIDEMLLPFSDTLKKFGHRGDFCVGAMIDKKGKAWPLEVTARMGYPAWFGQIASHKGDPAQWMRDLLDDKDTLRVSYDVCMGVVMGQPRFPYNDSKPEQVEGNPIQIGDEVLDNVHFCSVMKATGPVMESGKLTEAPIYQTAGEYVLVVTALGKTIERARKKVYAAVDEVHFPDAIYRNDGGDKVERNLETMHRHGYALELE